MWLRTNVVLLVAVVLAVIQMVASVTAGPRIGDPTALTGLPDRGLSRSAAAQEEDNDEDNEEDNEDADEDNEGDNEDADEDNEGDNEDSDNEDSDNDDADNDDADNDDADNDGGDEDGDNDDADADNDGGDEDGDNDDADADNDGDDEDADNTGDDALDEDADNTGADTIDDEDADNAGDDEGAFDDTPAPIAPTQRAPSPVAEPSPSPAPVTEVQGVTAGADMLLSLPGDRITVQAYANMPPDITLKLRLVDPLLYVGTPGIRAGDLIFQLEAFDAFGTPLATLPAEVTLTVTYADADVIGLDETFITMARLDPLASTWTTAPNLVADPLLNSLSASIFETGVYAVYVP